MTALPDTTPVLNLIAQIDIALAVARGMLNSALDAEAKVKTREQINALLDQRGTLMRLRDGKPAGAPLS